jgi:hypothetical protein
MSHHDHVRINSAEICVTVTEFDPVGTGSEGCTRADIELTDTGNGKVSQGRINDPIEVSAEVYLNFSVRGGEGDSHSYALVGISFRETTDSETMRAAGIHCREGSIADRLGHAAFSMRTIAAKGDTTQLTVFDANPEPREFEYSLMVQRSDGWLGVIDPKIRNRGVTM